MAVVVMMVVAWVVMVVAAAVMVVLVVVAVVAAVVVVLCLYVLPDLSNDTKTTRTIKELYLSDFGHAPITSSCSSRIHADRY